MHQAERITFWEKYQLWFIAVLLLFGLTIKCPSFYDPYLPVRTWVLFICFVILLIWLGKKKFEINAFALTLAGLFLWEIISLSWSYSVPTGLKYSFLTLTSLLLIIVFSQRKPEGNLSLLFRLNSLIVALNLGFAVYQLIMEGWEPYGIHGFALNKNLLAGLLLLSLPVNILAFIKHKGAIGRSIFYVEIILTFQFIIILQSRSAYLGVLLFVGWGLLFLFYVSKFGDNPPIKLFLKKFWPVPLIVILLSSLYLRVTDQETREDFIDKINIAHYFRETSAERMTPVTANNYESIAIRKVLWKSSWQLFLDQPMPGTGKGNWKIAVGEYATPSLPDRLTHNKAYSHAHNDLLQQLAETGIIGFILFIGPILLLLFFSLRSFPGQGQQIEVVLIFSGLASFLVISFFDFPFQQVEHRFLFYFQLLILYQILINKRNTRFQPRINLHRTWIISLCLVSAILAFLQWRSDGHAFKAVRLQSLGRLEEAQEHLEKIHHDVYNITPVNFPVSYMSGKILMNQGSAQKARTKMEKALQIQPFDPRIWNDYGVLLAMQNNREESLEAFREAIALAPYYEDPKYNMAAIYTARSEYDRALEILSQVAESPRKNNFLNHLIRKREGLREN